MSHFVVLVTNTDKESVDSQLEPFCEQGDECDSYMEKDYYLKNNEQEIDAWLLDEINSREESLEKTEEESIKKWDAEAVKKLKKIQKIKTINGKLKAIQKYNGGELDEEGLYWVYNPEAKYDWYTIGGRWNGWLVTNRGIECNVCRVGDIDFDGMRIKRMADSAKFYVEETERAKKDEREPFFWGWKKVPTIEEYIEASNRPVSSYAVLHDGKWYEKGVMGWWGISDDKYSDEEWDLEFQKFMEKLDPETEVTVVDCHI